MRRIAGLPLALLLSAAWTAGAGAEAPPAAEPPLTLARAVEIALSNNRALAAARLGRGIALAQVETARERPNPNLALELTKETPHDSLMLSQPVETGGKRRLRIGLAEAGVASGEADVARQAADTANAVRRAFFLLAAAERRAGEQEEVRRLAERTKDTAHQRFAAGDAPRLEELQAALALAQADNDREAAQGDVAGARSDFNTLLGRPPGAPLAVAADWGPGELPPAEAAVAAALRGNAALATLDRRLEEETARVALVRAQAIPDLAFDGSLTRRSEPDFSWGWRAGVSLTLPLFTRHQAAVVAEERTLAQMQAQRAAAAGQIAGDVSTALVQAAAKRRQALRYRDEILPQAEQVERMAEDAYRSGQSGLSPLLVALQATRDVRLKSIQAGLDLQNALADLERAMGVPLP